ncbi:MAG: Poly-beta,6 N-acetyl-D-glucosamine synthase PgaC/IcaA [Firmicutes bacterium]|nr:Poly-beta,6 N-acetyl-D-glucosamine synthase PgaC/IcaA [Bacillota bacterium]
MYTLKEFLEQFIFLYPFMMSIVWTMGAMYYYFRREVRSSKKPPEYEEYPFVSVIIPAHNEREAIKSTVNSVLASDYPNFEVIVVDDGSTDETPEILKELAAANEALRIILVQKNMGKAYALRCGTMASKGEIIVTIDGDAYLDPQAIRWMAKHFIEGPRVGAVTGNPRVRNRTSLLAKIQVGEYSTIIGMIKRTQRILGKVLTVSGAIAAFRRRALYDVGLWDVDMITDDINMTWKLEKRFWDIRYEPNALCWILVPETLRGLWRQRVRWAQGGVEVIKRHNDIWKSWKQRRLWPVYIEYVLSILWSYSYVVFGLFLLLLSFFIPVDTAMVKVYPPAWKGSMLAAVFLAQAFIGLAIDRQYEKKIVWYHFWVVWYPFLYWIITAMAAVWATPTALFKKMGAPAVWKSPDRGLFTKL